MPTKNQLSKAIRDGAITFFHSFYHSNPILSWTVGAALGLVIRVHLHR